MRHLLLCSLLLLQTGCAPKPSKLEGSPSKVNIKGPGEISTFKLLAKTEKGETVRDVRINAGNLSLNVYNLVEIVSVGTPDSTGVEVTLKGLTCGENDVDFIWKQLSSKIHVQVCQPGERSSPNEPPLLKCSGGLCTDTVTGCVYWAETKTTRLDASGKPMGCP